MYSFTFTYDNKVLNCDKALRKRVFTVPKGIFNAFAICSWV
jgi:hypothetical protein